jgi:FixJ family two-component response regulator
LKSTAQKTETIQPTVLIVDDDELYRRSIKRVLNASGYAVITYDSLAQFSTAKVFPRLGCAILDLNLPDSDGLEIQSRLAKLTPTLAVIFLSGFGRVSSSVRAMKAGAIDFLEKPIEDLALLKAVECALERSRQLLEETIELDDLRRRFEGLSKREQEVFALITGGLLNKQAGAELGVTEKTVKVHRAQVMAKMGAGSFAELVKAAQRLGLKANPHNTVLGTRI